MFIDRLAIVARPQIDEAGLTDAQRAELFARLLALALAHSNGIMASLPDFDIHANHAFTAD